MKPLHGRLLLFLGGTLLPLVGLELCLQAGSIYRAFNAHSERGPSSGESKSVVLCIGDSYTYGSGSSDPVHLSYPGRLQEFLDEHSRETGSNPWHVVNGGWPGRNSAELLQRTPGFLEEHQPDVLCVLVGINNRWSSADMDRPPPSGDKLVSTTGWQLRFRTKRFIELLWAKYQRRQLEIEPPEAGQVALQRPVRDIPRSMLPKLNPAEQPPTYRAVDKVLGRVRKQELGGAHEQIDALRARVRAEDHAPTQEHFLALLKQLRLHQETADEAFFAIEKYGESAVFCGHLPEPLTRLGRIEEALKWADVALGYEEGSGIAWLYKALAYVYGEVKDYEKMLSFAVKAWWITDRDAPLRGTLIRVCARSPSTFERFPEILAGFEMDPPVEDYLLSLAQQVAAEASSADEAGPPAVTTRLQSDLLQIAEMAQAAGTRVVFLTYPRRLADVHETLLKSATEAGCTLVDMAKRFEAVIGDGTHSDYTIPDGHPNDKGYEIYGRSVSAAILELVQGS